MKKYIFHAPIETAPSNGNAIGPLQYAPGCCTGCITPTNVLCTNSSYSLKVLQHKLCQFETYEEQVPKLIQKEQKFVQVYDIFYCSNYTQ